MSRFLVQWLKSVVWTTVVLALLVLAWAGWVHLGFIDLNSAALSISLSLLRREFRSPRPSLRRSRQIHVRDLGWEEPADQWSDEPVSLAGLSWTKVETERGI